MALNVPFQREAICPKCFRNGRTTNVAHHGLGSIISYGCSDCGWQGPNPEWRVSNGRCPHCTSTAVARVAGDLKCNQCGLQWRGNTMIAMPSLQWKPPDHSDREREFAILKEEISKLQVALERPMKSAIPDKVRPKVQEEIPYSKSGRHRDPHTQSRMAIVRETMKKKSDFADRIKIRHLCELLDTANIPLPRRGQGGSSERNANWKQLAKDPNHAVFGTLKRDLYKR
jgi:hypothetical protein